MKMTIIRSYLLILFTASFLVAGCKNAGENINALVPESAHDTISAENSGLIGGIYGSSNMKRLLKAGPESVISMRWDETSSNGSSWSAQWEGYLISPVTGVVILRLSTNKKAIVSLGTDEIINISETGKKDSAIVRLKRNKLYPLNIKYFQSSTVETPADEATFLELSWRYGRKDMMIIPEAAFRHSEGQKKNWMYLGEINTGPFNPADTSAYASDPVIIAAPELLSLDFTLPTGGLPLAVGTETFTICRADREHPERAEGLGYTYQHHQDIAIWQGRLYVGWNTCKSDEDTWPSREVYSTSVNGRDWTKPEELFPQGVSTPLRMYFYLSPRGRMLVIAGLRVSLKSLSERDKYGLVVREIYPNHTLGKVYTLRKPKEEVQNIPVFYNSSNDTGFVNACRNLLNDNLYLSQQDYGNLLEPGQKMKWFDPSLWEGGDNLRELATEFGKAMCFYKRKDGVTVSVSKRRWVTLSSDGGKSWSQPVRPKSLITGNGKVWGQATSAGRYYLIYNPDISKRWPLVLVSGSDGRTFRNPVSIGKELPEIRYEGKNKDRGLSYHRGLSVWNNDGSMKDDHVWIVYSVNKEDIVISRIPSDL